MKHMLVLLFIGISLVLASCQRELDEEDLVFRGDWDSPTYALQIYSNGYGMANSRRLGGLTVEGRVAVRGDRLIFTSNRENSSLPRKRFRINQRPDVEADGTVYMILDNESFTKR
jgi:hypothetical protein